MTIIDDKIWDEKLQHSINRKAAKISTLQSEKIDKSEYQKNTRREKEQAKFTFFPLGKASEKQTKTTERQGKKQVETLEVLDPEKKSKTKINWRTFSKRNGKWWN